MIKVLFMLILGIIIGFILGFGFFSSESSILNLSSRNYFNKVSFLNNNKSEDPNSGNSTSLVNLPSIGTQNEEMDAIFRAQLRVPASYLVTSDGMLDSYSTQGGMAPPRLILTKNYQLLSNDGNLNFLDKIWKYSSDDCISIWTTGGFGSINDWTSLGGDEGTTLSDKEEISVGNRKADLYKLSLKGGNVYSAFLPVKSKEGISYYFRTCNQNNKNDLVDIIKSIKLRVDIKY